MLPHAMNSVLLVEDSLDVQDLVKNILQPICHITAVPSMAKALKIVSETRFDLILMDVNLEDGDGFALTQLFRQKPEVQNIPLIFLTSLNDIEAQTKGFDLGAEDYIVKPFVIAEFKLRVESRLRKINAANLKKNEITRGKLKIHPHFQKASLIHDETNVTKQRELDLTPIQFKILHCLVENHPQIVDREKIKDTVWGNRIEVGRTIDIHMNSLRKKLDSPDVKIESVYGKGYRIFIKEASI